MEFVTDSDDDSDDGDEDDVDDFVAMVTVLYHLARRTTVTGASKHSSLTASPLQ